MIILIQSVADYAPWIYFICGVVALFQLYRAWQVRIERRQAVFSLEREKAARELGHIFSIAMLLLVIMGITYFTSTTLVRALEPFIKEAVAPNPEIPIFTLRPTTTPLPPTATPFVSAAVSTQPAVTPTDEPTLPLPTVAAPTRAPAPLAVQASACAAEGVAILRPGNNEQVSGTISMVGTATHPQFQFYKIEFAPAGSGNFSYLDGGNSPVVNGVLVNINSSALGNGAWTLRLTVVDQTGNFPAPCDVTIRVQN